jgi:Rad3-related DNA helicase
MNREQIKQKIEEFRITFLGENWKWRKGQDLVIEEIIETYVNKTHNVVILDAPVGSGKSIIAMAIAWILNQYGKEGYILASDITLQMQYEKDFKNFHLNWGSVKGIDNYMCIDNDEKNSL